MKMIRWIGIALGTLIALVALVAFGARFADGPVAMFPGGTITPVGLPIS